MFGLRYASYQLNLTIAIKNEKVSIAFIPAYAGISRWL